MHRTGVVRLFWIAAATALVAAALIALAAILTGSFDTADAQILGALATLLLAGAVATVGHALRESGRTPLLGAALLATSPLFAVVALAAIANRFDSESLGHAAGISYLLLATGLVVGTGRLLVGERRSVWPLFVALLVFSAAGAALSTVAIAGSGGGTGLGKTIAAAWVLAGVCYLLIPVGRRLTDEPAAAPRPLDLWAGADAPGTRVRLVETGTRLPSAAVVVVLAGEAQAGDATLRSGEAVAAPQGTTLVLADGARVLLVGR